MCYYTKSIDTDFGSYKTTRSVDVELLLTVHACTVSILVQIQQQKAAGTYSKF